MLDWLKFWKKRKPLVLIPREQEQELLVEAQMGIEEFLARVAQALDEHRIIWGFRDFPDRQFTIAFEGRVVTIRCLLIDDDTYGPLGMTQLVLIDGVELPYMMHRKFIHAFAGRFKRQYASSQELLRAQALHALAKAVTPEVAIPTKEKHSETRTHQEGARRSCGSCD